MTKIQSFLFSPSMTSASELLEYSVLSYLMASSVMLVFFTFSLPVSTISQSSPYVILFVCFAKSDSEVFFVVISTRFYSLQIYLISVSLSSTMSLIKWWHISMCLVRIPTCLFVSSKISPWLSSYITEEFCTSVISSRNILTNFSSCVHDNSATYYASVMLNVTVLWVFDENDRRVPPIVVNINLTLFIVSLSVA